MTATFLVGTIGDGLRKDLKAWATPNDSFDTLINAYQFRGRIRRKSGKRLLGNLANGTPVMGLVTSEGFNVGVQTLVAFDTTQAYKFNGTAFVPLPSVMPVTWSGTDYQFFDTANYAGSLWVTNSKSGLNGVDVANAVAGAGFTTITTTTPNGFTSGQSVTLINLGGTTDLDGNTYIITVTGPSTFTIPFQTAGVYTSNGIALNSQVSITGQDGIRYYGVLTDGTGWANYNPPIDPFNALVGALLIFPYRGYLVFLNTTEGNEQGVFNYENRARWTQIGTPYYALPVPVFPAPQGVDPTAVRDDLFGKGGASDAPTNEAIVGADFIRDILVVYFERSTWRLRFVNNAQNPFVWERINKELGSDCTFSTIPFDKGLMAIGNRGIVISDANDVIRFDEKIPDQIFDIRQSNQGLQRVYGIRTFRTKLTYWTYPSDDQPLAIYPDKVLVYNYESKTWAFFDDTFTCFGYYYPAGQGYTWAQLTEAWSSYTDISWNSGVSQEGQETIIAGNQQGFVFILEQGGAQNDPSLNISNIVGGVVTSANHNFVTGRWITLSGVTGTTSTDGVSLNGRNFQIGVIDADNFNLNEYQSIDGGPLVAASIYTYTIGYQYILAGSPQINIGSLVFTDPGVNGILVEASSGGSGTIDYLTGIIDLTFNSPQTGEIYIRVVTLDQTQDIDPVATTGAYTGGGQIAEISNFDIQSKIFNFLPQDKRARLSQIDFYVNRTANGQFTANIFADSSNVIANAPLPDNLQSNVVLTQANPYQIGNGDETIYRLWCETQAQTVQVQLTLSNAQMAVTSINREDLEILAMSFKMRQGGRLV
jgi:hypothetical protein